MTQWIDRIDLRGNIVEHAVENRYRTLCGLALGMTQPSCGNRRCKKCERIVRLKEPKVNP